MDMITLAMAKAYTDEKCGSGGGGGLPMVELETPVKLNEPTPLSGTDAENMTSCIKNPSPIILKLTLSALGLTGEGMVVMNYFNSSGLGIGFAGMIMNMPVMAQFADGTWAVMISTDGE